MLKPSYPVRTERLLLRPFTADDFDDVCAIHSRADVTRYLYWEPRDPHEVRKLLTVKAERSTLEAEGDSLNLAVELRDGGAVIGDVTLFWLSDKDRQGEVGFVFNPDYHGRGYATEAAAAMLALGFADLGLHRIIGRLDGRNTASARVLERLDMRREAHLVENEIVKGEWTDEVVYAMLDREWRARHT